MAERSGDRLKQSRRDLDSAIPARYPNGRASGRSLPSSEADILIVARDTAERCIDRASVFRDYFSDIEEGVDLFVYTEPEVISGSIPVTVTALRTGIVLDAAQGSSKEGGP